MGWDDRMGQDRTMGWEDGMTRWEAQKRQRVFHVVLLCPPLFYQYRLSLSLLLSSLNHLWQTSVPNMPQVVVCLPGTRPP